MARSDPVGRAATPEYGQAKGVALMIFIIALVILGVGAAIILSTLLGGRRSAPDQSD